MKVYKIQLKSTDSTFEFTGTSLYTKGGFACIAYTDAAGNKRVRRWPLCGIHSIDCEY